MLTTYYIEQSELPPFNDDRMRAFAAELRDELEGYKNASNVLRTEIWPECYKAFMAIRKLPRGKTMAWVDNGLLGESDARQGVEDLLEAYVNSMMPPDEAWLTAVSHLEEDQAILDKVKDRQSYLHRIARTRQKYEQHLLQLIIYGTSCIHVCWEKRFAIERIQKKNRKKIQQYMDAAGGVGEDGQPLRASSLRRWRETYNGPLIQPIDMHRVYLDPTADLMADDVPSIILVFKSLSDLEGAVDEETGDKIYTNLEGIKPFTPQQLYAEDSPMFDSMKHLGITPNSESIKGEVVPVYIFHRRERVFDFDGTKDKWIDMFFYLARSNEGNEFRIIRAHENPSDYGHKPFIIDTYSQWLNASYGTGAVEKSLPAYHAKNLVAALTLNAQVATVFPAMNYIVGVTKDDRHPLVGPGQLNALTWRPGVGLDFMKPVPLQIDGSILGTQAQQFLGAKIQAQMGATGGGTFTDPTKTVPQEKTATQVRQEAMNFAGGKENKIEKFTINSLQPLCQMVYDYDRQYQSKGKVTYLTRKPTGEVSPGYIMGRDLNKERTIEIVGRKGIANKRDEIANLTEALKTLSQGNVQSALPNYALLLQDIVYKLFARLGIEIKDEYKLTPMQIAVQDPGAILQMLEKAASLPEAKQMIEQMIMQEMQTRGIDAGQGQPPPV